MSSPRQLPNILITGTPATGKTTLCETLISRAQSSIPPLQLQHLSINDIIKSSRSFHSTPSKPTSRSSTNNQPASADHALIVDDSSLDALMDHLSLLISDGASPGGFILDWHSTSGFAVRWIDLVVVLTCPDTSGLYDRLTARGYSEEKVQENMDAEIFGVAGEEAREAWGNDSTTGEGQVVELKSEKAEDVEENAERILSWIGNWMGDREGKEEG